MVLKSFRMMNIPHVKGTKQLKDMEFPICNQMDRIVGTQRLRLAFYSERPFSGTKQP